MPRSHDARHFIKEIQLVMPRSSSDEKSGEKRKDGRRPLLVYLKPDVIRRLKVKALDLNTHAYLVAEEAIEKLLAEQSQSPSE